MHCYATLYITSEIAVSWTIFSTLLLPQFYECLPGGRGCIIIDFEEFEPFNAEYYEKNITHKIYITFASVRAPLVSR